MASGLTGGEQSSSHHETSRAWRAWAPARAPPGSAPIVDIEQHRVTYSVSRGAPLTAHHYGEEFTVSPGSPVSFSGEYRTFDAPPAATTAAE